jgi:N-acetylglucosamine-6-sulfatase
MGSSLRQTTALVLSIGLLLVAVVVAGAPRALPELPPNVLLVITDDQSIDSLPSDPPAMPWLQSQIADPSSGWLWFPNAIVSTPMCCPSRSSILTGLDAIHTGVGGNEDGGGFDDAQTLAVWLQDAGYRTGLIGKYLNGYPFDGPPTDPPVWGRWLANTNDSIATTYYGYRLVDQGRWRVMGREPGDYITDVLGSAAVDFLGSAPADRPWFLAFTPSAPHPPWIPAPRYTGAFDGITLPPPDGRVMNDVRGKPDWVRALPQVGVEQVKELQRDRILERETLLAVDAWLHRMEAVITARGEWDRTVVVFLSDNGFEFGEHRWVGKQAPYEPSIRVPFAIRSPWVSGRVVDDLVANLDVAPTIATVAGVGLPWTPDGIDLSPLLHGRAAAGLGSDRTVPLFWEGGPEVPAWTGLRSPDGVCIRSADGTLERYDLVSDPDELVNRRSLRNIGCPSPGSVSAITLGG